MEVPERVLQVMAKAAEEWTLLETELRDRAKDRRALQSKLEVPPSENIESRWFLGEVG